MIDRLINLKGKTYVGVAELGDQAAELLEITNTYQEKRTVTEFPDERTIRYYISEGLLPPALEKQGSASVFGYVHLLALLAIKKLQAQDFPIKKIREILNGKTSEELEKLLDTEREEGNEKNEAQRYLESLLFKQGNGPRDTQSPVLSSPIAAPSPYRGRVQRGSRQAPLQSWIRYEIEQGLEIHIEDKFKVPSDSREMRTLIQEIEEIILSHRNRQI
jgi:DNA-binding transcriptional MerR regulator